MTQRFTSRSLICAFATAVVLFAQPELRAADSPANPSFSTTFGDIIKDHDFGVYKLGAAGAIFTFDAYNLPAPTGTTSAMTLTGTNPFGDSLAISLQTGTISGLAPGNHAPLQLTLTTNQRGRLAVSYTLDFVSDTASGGPLGHLAIGGHAIISPPGDYDSDGDVDSVDYGIWRSHFGSTYAAADGNQNGIVDAADYDIWRKYYSGPLGSGNSLPEGSALSGSSAVPEPGAAILAFLGAAFAGLRRRTHRCSVCPPQRTPN